MSYDWTDCCCPCDKNAVLCESGNIAIASDKKGLGILVRESQNLAVVDYGNTCTLYQYGDYTVQTREPDSPYDHVEATVYFRGSILYEGPFLNTVRYVYNYDYFFFSGSDGNGGTKYRLYYKGGLAWSGKMEGLYGVNISGDYAAVVDDGQWRLFYQNTPIGLGVPGGIYGKFRTSVVTVDGLTKNNLYYEGNLLEDVTGVYLAPSPDDEYLAFSKGGRQIAYYRAERFFDEIVDRTEIIAGGYFIARNSSNPSNSSVVSVYHSGRHVKDLDGEYYQSGTLRLYSNEHGYLWTEWVSRKKLFLAYRGSVIVDEYASTSPPSTGVQVYVEGNYALITRSRAPDTSFDCQILMGLEEIKSYSYPPNPPDLQWGIGFEGGYNHCIIHEIEYQRDPLSHVWSRKITSRLYSGGELADTVYLETASSSVTPHSVFALSSNECASGFVVVFSQFFRKTWLYCNGTKLYEMDGASSQAPLSCCENFAVFEGQLFYGEAHVMAMPPSTLTNCCGKIFICLNPNGGELIIVRGADIIYRKPYGSQSPITPTSCCGGRYAFWETDDPKTLIVADTEYGLMKYDMKNLSRVA